MFFVSLRKLFSFLRKSNINFLDIQTSWRYQLPNHETPNTYYWITWEVDTIWEWNLAILQNETFYQKGLLKNMAGKLVPGPFQFSKNPL